MIVRSTEDGPPARGTQAFHHDRRGARDWRCPRASTARPGRGARDRPARRHPAARRRRRAAATSPSEWPASRGAPSIATPPSMSGAPGPNGCASCPIPDRTAGPSGASRVADAGEIGGHGHLEVGRVAGDDVDGDSTGLQQGGLIGPGPGGGDRGRRRPSRSRPRRTPWGVWAAPSVGPVHGRDDAVAVDALDGLDDRHDRDGRPVALRRLRHGGRRAPGATTGRAPSWTRTTRVPSGSGSADSRAANPAATESWRRAATDDDGPDLGRAATARRPAPSTPLGGRHDDDRLDLGRAARPSSV